MDFPPANVIKPNDIRNYPIIRCEDCHKIPIMDLNMDKKEIQLKCEKEGKIKYIPFEDFFQTIKKYEDINCCEFCKSKNPSQKYYLCKTCSNKILCENCFNEHDKKDDVIKFEIDSTCQKHYHQFESFCPICKENKCSYCSIDHDESHEIKEVLLKKKLFKKNKIEGLKNTIKKIQNDKGKIEQKINVVIKELEEKLEFINNLKNKFFECLNMKIQFVELILSNYEKKIENYNMNYYIANNLERQINFNLLELNINKGDSLDKKIQNISDYINENLNSKFSLDNEEGNYQIIKQESIWDKDATDVDYNVLQSFEYYNIIGFLDFNKDLIVLYSSDTLYFISKNDFKIKFKLKEYGLNEIQICKKINDLKLLIYTKENIIFVDIIDNNDYKVNKKIDFSSNIYDFNSHLDLLSLKHKNYSYYLVLLLFPDFNKKKYSIELKKCSKDDRLKFINNNLFFHISPYGLRLYEIKNNNNNVSSDKSLKIEIDPKNIDIIELNSEYYCLNDKSKILLLNKLNLDIAKTISSVSNNLGILKISDKLISIFISEYYFTPFHYNNYIISSNGIKWDLFKQKNLLEKKEFKNFYFDNNYILFVNNNECSLFNIKIKK